MRSLNRAVVVGGGGFYGSWIVDALLAEDAEVSVVDSRGCLPDHVGRVGVFELDAERSDLSDVLPELAPDVIFQLRGTGLVPVSVADPIKDMDRNLRSTLGVLESARAMSRPPLVVFVSSAAVYGEAVVLPMDESHPLRPLSPYGISKLAAEHYVRLYADLFGLSTLSVRPFSIYGPRQRKLAVYDLMVRALGGEAPLRVHGSPEVTRDFVYVADAAAAAVALARSAPGTGEAYNIASGRPTTIGELVHTIVSEASPGRVVEFTGELRPGDPLRWEGDGTLARSFGATFDTDLGDGLRETVAWLRASNTAAAE